MTKEARRAAEAGAALAWHVQDLTFFAEQLEQTIGEERFAWVWRDFIEWVDGFIEPEVGKLLTALEADDVDSVGVPPSVH